MDEFKNDCYKLATKHCLCIEFAWQKTSATDSTTVN